MPNPLPMIRDEAIKQVVAQLTEPTSVAEVVQRVLAFWPSTAKTAANTIRQGLRHDQAGKTLIFLTDQTVAPIGLALRGVQFRISLSRQEVERSLVFAQPNFTCFLPYQVPAETVSLLTRRGDLFLPASSA